MASYCARCGREAALQAGADGGMYCPDCARALNPACMDCRSCSERYCGGVMACPFCPSCAGNAEEFKKELEKPLQPLRIEEKCERCGGGMPRAFIINGKAVCRDCLVYEQEKWEIVPGKPGKGGSRVRIVIEKPGPIEAPGVPEREPGAAGEKNQRESQEGRRLFQMIGVDIDNPPPDPFASANPISEKPMPKDACVNCEAYRLGTFGENKRGKQKAGNSKAPGPKK